MLIYLDISIPSLKSGVDVCRFGFKTGVIVSGKCEIRERHSLNLLCKQSLHYPPRLALAILRASVVVCILEYFAKSLNKLLLLTTLSLILVKEAPLVLLHSSVDNTLFRSIFKPSVLSVFVIAFLSSQHHGV